jgi:hypothetical protein
MTMNGDVDGSKTFQKTKQKVLTFTTFPFSISKLFFFPISIFVEMFSFMNEANVIWLFLVVKNLNFMSKTRFVFFISHW